MQAKIAKRRKLESGPSLEPEDPDKPVFRKQFDKKTPSNIISTKATTKEKQTKENPKNQKEEKKTPQRNEKMLSFSFDEGE